MQEQELGFSFIASLPSNTDPNHELKNASSLFSDLTVYTFIFTKVVLTLRELTRLAIDYNCCDYFANFQPEWQGLLYFAYMLVNMAAEMAYLGVDSFEGLLNYICGVIKYLAIFGALMLAINLAATALDYYYPHTLKKTQFQARSRLVTAEDIAECDQCSICLVEYTVGVDRII